MEEPRYDKLESESNSDDKIDEDDEDDEDDEEEGGLSRECSELESGSVK